jgi:hypothetical protein
MAKLISKIRITATLDPIIDVVCFNVKCINNLAVLTGDAHCNRKHISISENGICEAFIQIDNL